MLRETSTQVLAAVQMTSGAVLDDNVTQAIRFVDEAASKGADVVALPENFSLMPEDDAQRQDAARRVEEVEAALSEVAKKHGIILIAGSTPFPAGDGRVTNSCLVFGRDGQRLGRYDKIHLFDVHVSAEESYRESAYIAPGVDPLVVHTEEITLGITICYDMRFPELYRQLSQAGATIFSVPSAFTVPTGRAHWHTLLRARAIENLAWVIAPAQVGIHPRGRHTFGHTLIVDPWGEVLAERADGPGVVLATIELGQGEKIRRRFPALSHRRLI
ncbi:MAG: carbon-nitrogen hydrolase family protein [Arenicellales bacterium]